MTNLAADRLTPEFTNEDDIHTLLWSPERATLTDNHSLLSVFFSLLETISNKLDSSICRHAKQLQKLTLSLLAVLPPECDGHYHVAGIRGDTVIIVCDSPVWATRIRQLGPGIIAHLRQQGSPCASLQHIQACTRPSLSVEPGRGALQNSNRTTKTQPRKISEDSATLLRQTADSISDSGLRKALARLAERGKKS